MSRRPNFYSTTVGIRMNSLIKHHHMFDSTKRLHKHNCFRLNSNSKSQICPALIYSFVGLLFVKLKPPQREIEIKTISLLPISLF